MTATARRLDHALPRVEMRSPALIARQEAAVRARRLMPHPDDVLGAVCPIRIAQDCA